MQADCKFEGVGRGKCGYIKLVEANCDGVFFWSKIVMVLVGRSDIRWILFLFFVIKGEYT